MSDTEDPTPPAPGRSRKNKLLSVVLEPEDKEIIDWLDEVLYFGKRSGEIEKDFNRSRMIMGHLRAAMAKAKAEQIKKPVRKK